MKYKIETTSLSGVLLLTPEFDGEEESSFSFDLRAFQAAIHADVKFVQDNHSPRKAFYVDCITKFRILRVS